MDCPQNTDPLKLVREGTSQEQRAALALAPASAPVDERTPAHDLVFAQAYARYLRYYSGSNVALGNWQQFFAQDVSVQLALAAVQDVAQYRAQVSEYFAFANNLDNQADAAGLKTRLGYLFSSLGTLARQLDNLQATLPPEVALQATLQNLIRSQLAVGFRRLVAYYKADAALPEPDQLIAGVAPEWPLLGSPALPFADLYAQGLSGHWITDSSADWATYQAAIAADASGFGTGTTVFEQVNHLSTHNLFTGIFDQFLKVYARVVADAKVALEATFTSWDGHEPHYALFLAFLRLREYARQETNTLTGRHLDFYYRDVLRLREKPAEPGHAHLLLELARHVEAQVLEPGQLFKAGKDSTGKDAFFANDRAFVANQAQVAALQTVYRHGSEKVGTGPNATRQTGRLYAAPVANSDDGLGTKLTTVDQSWHPFYHKTYLDGKLAEIAMPPAQIGFAVASHYLWLAEGQRDITLNLTVSGYTGAVGEEWGAQVSCALSGEKGWLSKAPGSFKATSSSNFRLVLSVAGDEAAVVAYSSALHGLNLDASTPVLLVQLQQQSDLRYAYPQLENVRLQQVQLQVSVDEVKNLVLSNDFGLLDAAKPFLPFGAQPEAGSALVLGSQELFQKKLAVCEATIRWKNLPAVGAIAYQPWEQYFPQPAYDWYSKAVPVVTVAWLQAGKWANATSQTLFDGNNDTVLNLKPPTGEFNKLDAPHFQLDATYAITTKTGYVRLALPQGMGHKQYREALADYFVAVANKNTAAVKPTEPYTPEIEAISVRYTASQTIALTSADKAGFDHRAARLYHLAPFGQAEQHPYLKAAAPDTAIYLLPPFRHLNTTDDAMPAGQPVLHEAEFYVGIVGLQPPQNLALLFQVVDGTADPLAQKPRPHLHWSYLRANEWLPFASTDVADETRELLDSGIVTLAVPRDATSTNSLLPGGLHWIRVAVAGKSEAVSCLVAVAAQALRATFSDHANDPAFAASILPANTIGRLAQPVAAIKKVKQPFPSFGGRGQETPAAFYTRVSERLRHKDRAIALWDYERLVLEAFPQLYQVKCLPHTQYQPTASGTGIYRELAPGHVTVVTVPNLQFRNLRDPLRPYTSLGLLQQIADFLRARGSCFVKLHVENPQFEEVRVNFKVRLYPGFDETFYTRRLQEDITRFLSPWAFAGSSGSPSFGGKVYKSVLINFVEEQPYVDYVTNFQLFHKQSGPGDQQEVRGSRAVSILVSVPARQHLITVIDLAEEEVSREECPCQA